MTRAGFQHIEWIGLSAALIVSACWGRFGFADDGAQRQAAADFVQASAESLTVAASEADQKRLQLRKSPLLKYSDPARRYSAAGVWRLGDAGRPQALVSLQIQLRDDADQPQLTYELLSFTQSRFEVRSAQAALPADGTATPFVALESAAKPAGSDKQRLLQLRALARRFSVSEKYGADIVALRLLPQPIDRYSDSTQGIVDGAAFVFAYGTNPEAALVLECDEKGWRYALARMAWAELVASLDGKEVARFDELTGHPASGSYRSAGHTIELPILNSEP